MKRVLVFNELLQPGRGDSLVREVPRPKHSEAQPFTCGAQDLINLNKSEKFPSQESKKIVTM